MTKANVVLLLTLLASACAEATTLRSTLLNEVFQAADYVGIVRLERIKNGSQAQVVIVEASQVEAIKGDRSGSTFMISVPASDLVPESDQLLVILRAGSESAPPREQQWIFPVVTERDESFVFANRDNIFFNGPWLSTGETIPLFVVEGNRIHAAMNLTAVRHTLSCAESGKKVCKR